MPDRPKLTALNDETRNATGKNVGDSNFVLLCHTIHIAPHKYLLSTRACFRHIASLFSYYRPCLGTQRACVRVPSASGCVMGGVASIGTNVPMRGQAPPNTSASNAPQTPSTPTPKPRSTESVATRGSGVLGGVRAWAWAWAWCLAAKPPEASVGGEGVVVNVKTVDAGKSAVSWGNGSRR